MSETAIRRSSMVHSWVLVSCEVMRTKKILFRLVVVPNIYEEKESVSHLDCGVRYGYHMK